MVTDKPKKITTSDLRKRTRSNGKYYIDKKELMDEFVKSKEQGKMTNKFGEMVMLMAKKLGNSSRFCGYTYIDDMEATAIMHVCRSWQSYDPEKSPQIFSYYTQCIWNTFLQILKTEKKQRNVRDAIMLSVGLNPSDTFLDDNRQKTEDNKDET
jgi:DNA-directed RNA polymerase specialized sigma subunit